MTQQKLMIIPYSPAFAEQTVAMWRDSKEQAIGQKEMHSVENHVYFLNHLLPEQFQIELAIIDETVVGMIAYNKEGNKSTVYSYKLSRAWYRANIVE